jgi:hypothetical protein
VDNRKQLLALPWAEEIGITLAEEDQLEPQQSTSAIVVPHSQAKYFSVSSGVQPSAIWRYALGTVRSTARRCVRRVDGARLYSLGQDNILVVDMTGTSMRRQILWCVIFLIIASGGCFLFEHAQAASEEPLQDCLSSMVDLRVLVAADPNDLASAHELAVEIRNRSKITCHLAPFKPEGLSESGASKYQSLRWGGDFTQDAINLPPGQIAHFTFA